MSAGTHEKTLEAVRCCRRGLCDICPLQEEICDELCVEMEEVPAGLLDRIEHELKPQK